METSLDAPTENSAYRKRLIIVITTIVFLFFVVAGAVIALMMFLENKRRRAYQLSEQQSHELPTLEQQQSPLDDAVPIAGPITTTTPSLTTLTSVQLSIPLESGPTASVVTSPLQSHLPTPIREMDDPLARPSISTASPASVHTRSTSTQRLVNMDDGHATVFGSIQQRGLQCPHRPTRLDLSVDTLPPYEEPPSYHTEDGFSAPVERL